MKVFWFDVETGGLDEKKNPILQLAYVIEIDGQRMAFGEFKSKGFKGCEINDKALAVNGLTLFQVSTYPPEIEMFDGLIGVLSAYVDRYDKTDKFVLAGYNVRFDERFLRALWERHGDKYFGAWFAFNTIDPSNVVRFMQYAGKIPELAQMRLTDVAKLLEVEQPNAHDALVDIEMTIAVNNKLKELLCP